MVLVYQIENDAGIYYVRLCVCLECSLRYMLTFPTIVLQLHDRRKINHNGKPIDVTL